MFFFKKKSERPNFDKLYQQIKSKFDTQISEERQRKLSEIIYKNGFYPASFENADLTESEILFCLDKKSQNSDKEYDMFDIKIINLNAFTNMMQWLKELVILPKNTVIYLIPFHKRDFNCAYFIKSMDIDANLNDENFEMSAKEQIQLFIHLAQKAGHSVIYDFLMRTSRYSTSIIENPYLVRWIDTNFAQDKITAIVDNVASELESQFEKDDIEIIKNIYNQESKGCLSEEYNTIYEIFEKKVFEKKKELSNEIYKLNNQIKLQKRVMGKSAETLIKEGLWTVPCAADNEFGLPVFDYMNNEEHYPVFKHFDKNGNDISQSIKDDFQTPAFFMDLETKEINKKVLSYFIDMAKKYIEDYNFDGFKINYTENLFVNNDNDKIPPEFLKKLISEIKKSNKILIADGDFEHLKQYQGLGFDSVWIKDETLTPREFLNKYETLANYNTEDLRINNIDSVKIYNDKFGANSFLTTSPAQSGREGALFKWFCLHFLPTGRNAKLPILYLDGDESFTKQDFAKTIFENEHLCRNNDEEFYKKFNAINSLAKRSKLIREGEAAIITEDSDGFVSWLIAKEPLKEMILVVANYKNFDEKLILQNDNEKIETFKENDAVVNKMISLPGECRIVSEYIFDGEHYVSKDYALDGTLFEIEVLKPNDFRIFLLRK
ncbi:hypothetical protein IJ732_07885 [bacterium]|nr:hypothetical protein [bacterium]